MSLQYIMCIKIIVLIILCVVLVCLLYKFLKQREIIYRKNVDVNLRMAILKKMFDEIVDIANNNSINLFIIYGTLLGKIRNNDLICYDYDLDFGVLLEHFCKLKNIIKTNFSKKYKIEIYDNPLMKYIKIIDKKTLLSADISSFDYNDTHIWRQIIPYYAQYIDGECIFKMPIKWILPLKKTIFLNKQINIPNDYMKLLKCYYGKTYLIPDHKCDNNCTNCIKITH